MKKYPIPECGDFRIINSPIQRSLCMAPIFFFYILKTNTYEKKSLLNMMLTAAVLGIFSCKKADLNQPSSQAGVDVVNQQKNGSIDNKTTSVKTAA
ncbi:MAG: hypothetical protein IPL84_08810 [Chitinophagaceae bacterium]|nr:hypothetical protein [Chitinophagaceae bacterium]